MQKIIVMTAEEFEELQQRIFKKMLVEENFVTNKSEHPPDESENYLSHKEAAKFLGCCNNTLTRLRLEGKIPYSKLGRQIKISKQALIKFLKPNKL